VLVTPTKKPGKCFRALCRKGAKRVKACSSVTPRRAQAASASSVRIVRIETKPGVVREGRCSENLAPDLGSGNLLQEGRSHEGNKANHNKDLQN
jgi:hypothetical protein